MSEHELRKLPSVGQAVRENRCENCLSYAPDPKQLRVGLCCHEPPKAVPTGGGGIMGMWPPVKGTDFCVTAFQPKPPVIA